MSTEEEEDLATSRDVLILGVFGFAAVIGEGLAVFLHLPGTWGTLTAAVTGTAAVVALFKVDPGLPPRRAGQGAVGLVAGALAAVLVCAVPGLVGAMLYAQRDLTVGGALGYLGAIGPGSVGEELLMRGVAFEALRRWRGDAAAVILSSAGFGAAHALNPQVTFAAASVVALIGLWFGAVRVATGSLWAPIGVHLAWNLVIGLGFGHPLSGFVPSAAAGIPIAIAPVGFWNGGSFGPEASGWAAVVTLTAFAATLALAWVRPPPSVSGDGR